MSWLGATLAAFVLLTSSPAWAQAEIPGAKPAAAPAAGATGAAAPVTSEAAPPQSPGALGMLLPIAAMGLFFWLFIIRPQNKQAKEHKALLESLKPGDQVLTNAGIFGKITGFDEENQAVVVESANDTRIRVLKSQVGKKVGEPAAAKSAPDAKPQPAK